VDVDPLAGRHPLSAQERFQSAHQITSFADRGAGDRGSNGSAVRAGCDDTPCRGGFTSPVAAGIGCVARWSGGARSVLESAGRTVRATPPGAE
jgi:hypothetical protein